MANELSNLQPSPGSRRSRMRLGRGEGSGKGKTAGRGTKGQHARNTVRAGFEGGQMPLQRRLPKRGFNNIFAKRYTEVGLDKIASKFAAGETVNAAALKERGVIAKIGRDGVKVLGNGDIGHALTIQAARFTKSAAEKISAAGGTAETV
jgi:large subunit ribosomal protein L15